MRKSAEKLIVLTACILLIPLTACTKLHGINPGPVQPVTKIPFEYSIKVLKNGKIEVFDSTGKRRDKVKKPDKPLKKLRERTIIEAKGSCYVIWGGVYYNVC